MKNIGLVVMIAVVLTACGYDHAQHPSASLRYKIVCYSAATVILDDIAASEVYTRDGVVSYKSNTTKKWVQSSADCVVTRI